jgi:hypothetical protein
MAVPNGLASIQMAARPPRTAARSSGMHGDLPGLRAFIRIGLTASETLSARPPRTAIILLPLRDRSASGTARISPPNDCISHRASFRAQDASDPRSHAVIRLRQSIVGPAKRSPDTGNQSCAPLGDLPTPASNRSAPPSNRPAPASDRPGQPRDDITAIRLPPPAQRP